MRRRWRTLAAKREYRIKRGHRWRQPQRQRWCNQWAGVGRGGFLMRFVFLALAIWGAIHPMYYFIQWFQTEGWSLMGMVDAWHANAASSGLVWDLTIAAIALTVWIITEVTQTKNTLALIAIPATFCIGVSCGLPLYLFLRGRVVYTRDKHSVRDY